MIQSRLLLFLLLQVSLICYVANGLITLPVQDDEDSSRLRCIGLEADFSRVEDVDNDYLDQIQAPEGNRNFQVLSVNRITRAGSEEVLSDRVRLEERIEGVKIHGADVVVSFEGCERGICPLNVKGLEGKTFKSINVTEGYTATVSEDEGRAKIMEDFEVSSEGIGNLTLRVFAATSGDYLAYFTDVFVEKEGGDVGYYNVIVDAHNLDFLSICSLVGSSAIGRNKKNKPPKRYLRQLEEEGGRLFSATGINCESCASDSTGVSWGSELSSCPINTLYLDDTNRQTICTVGTDKNGQTVYGAGPVPDLFWGGTKDCKSTTNQCRSVILPECSDAISDVQFGAITTLQYFQEYLGINGGLRESGDDPVPIQANVHYNKQYCNAFYRFSVNTVFFGDCDCSEFGWTPLTSIDIIAHEIAHGVTKHTSGLEYQYQSGGMNEGFSDIVGAVVEFLINDSVDTPDFDVGEQLGNKLRSMEFPSEGRTSISSVCEYNSDMAVHFTSGPLNKAFVNSVRSCQANGCSDERGCTILLGTIFMYANIQSLTTYSGYLDGARATCSIVEEYFVAKSPTTQCTEDQVTEFIRQGWLSVNVALDDTCQSRNCCSNDCPTRPVTPASASRPTPSPTIGPTSSQQQVPAISPAPAEQTEAPSDVDGVIVKIFRILQGIFSIFNTVFGG